MNQYFEVIQQAMILYPAIVVLVTIPYIAWNYHKYGSVLSLRVLIVYSFILYLLCVYCLVILPLPSPEEAALLHGRRMQLTPFAFVGAVIRQAGIVPGDPATWRRIPSSSSFWTTLFNLFMTLPFGVYLRYYFCCGWKKTLGLAFGLSLFCELTQLSGLYFLYPGSYRLFDVDDLIVNTAGSMVGYALAGPLEMLLPSRQELDAASFQRGTEVSFPRRVFSFGVDLVCVELLSLALGGASALLGAALPSLAGPVLFWAYFALVPLAWQGRTPGKRLTRQRIVHTGGRPRQALPIRPAVRPAAGAVGRAPGPERPGGLGRRSGGAQRAGRLCAVADPVRRVSVLSVLRCADDGLPPPPLLRKMVPHRDRQHGGRAGRGLNRYIQ